MTFGDEGHRVQERSARRMEVCCLFLVICLFVCFQRLSRFSVHSWFSDLDSAVSSGGLDRILTPPGGQIPNQPSTRSFFQSVTVTKVVKPDGVRGTVFCEIVPNLLQFSNWSKKVNTFSVFFFCCSLLKRGELFVTVKAKKRPQWLAQEAPVAWRDQNIRLDHLYQVSNK